MRLVFWTGSSGFKTYLLVPLLLLLLSPILLLAAPSFLSFALYQDPSPVPACVGDGISKLSDRLSEGEGEDELKELGLCRRMVAKPGNKFITRKD